MPIQGCSVSASVLDARPLAPGLGLHYALSLNLSKLSNLSRLKTLNCCGTKNFRHQTKKHLHTCSGLITACKLQLHILLWCEFIIFQAVVDDTNRKIAERKAARKAAATGMEESSIHGTIFHLRLFDLDRLTYIREFRLDLFLAIEKKNMGHIRLRYRQRT